MVSRLIIPIIVVIGIIGIADNRFFYLGIILGVLYMGIRILRSFKK